MWLPCSEQVPDLHAWLVQAFSAWIHICAIRLFAESILRYGVPPQFLTALVKPNAKTTTKLRKLLASMFASESKILLADCASDNFERQQRSVTQPHNLC